MRACVYVRVVGRAGRCARGTGGSVWADVAAAYGHCGGVALCAPPVVSLRVGGGADAGAGTWMQAGAWAWAGVCGQRWGHTWPSWWRRTVRAARCVAAGAWARRIIISPCVHGCALPLRCVRVRPLCSRCAYMSGWQWGAGPACKKTVSTKKQTNTTHRVMFPSPACTLCVTVTLHARAPIVSPTHGMRACYVDLHRKRSAQKTKQNDSPEPKLWQGWVGLRVDQSTKKQGQIDYVIQVTCTVLLSCTSQFEKRKKM